MVTLAGFGHRIIGFCKNEHELPNFYSLALAFGAVFEIAILRVIKEDREMVRRYDREAMAWAKEERTVLREAWTRHNPSRRDAR